MPYNNTGIGVDELPGNIRHSTILTDCNLNQLATVAELPVIDPAYHDETLKNIFQYYSINPQDMEKELQLYAKELLDAGNINAAWQVLLTIG